MARGNDNLLGSLKQTRFGLTVQVEKLGAAKADADEAMIEKLEALERRGYEMIFEIGELIKTAAEQETAVIERNTILFRARERKTSFMKVGGYRV